MQQFKRLFFVILLTSACNMIAMDDEQKSQSNAPTNSSKKRALEFSCSHCSDTFETEYALADHQRATHPMKNNVRIPAYIIAQQKAQKDLPDLPCKFCPSAFKEQGLLDFHYYNDHKRCTVCFEEVTNSYLHTKEKHPETIIKIESDDEIRARKKLIQNGDNE